ncbi:MAG TPA: GNAT family N-acetyltransferase, partial [Thermoanaerobaculia bacterium]
MSRGTKPPLAAKPGFEYPERYEADIVLRNGSTLRLRPIRASDGPLLRRFHDGLSPESLYWRFHHVPGGDPEAAHLSEIDYENRFALVGETAEGIVALGRFDRDPRHPERAEAAFMILDGLQGQGIGTSLLERLAAIAREKGIETFEADVLPANRPMLDVFINSGLAMTQKLAAGVIRVALSIAPTAPFLEKSGSRHRQAAAASLEAFFRPRVVAVVGAGRRRGKIGSEILHNILGAGFRGRVVPVNPKAKSVARRRSYPTIGAIPGRVDLAIIAVPAQAVAEVVDDAIEKGVKGVVVISAGFAETGGEGRRREAALLETIRAGRIRMIGPNCMGLVNTDPRVRLNATFA